MGKFQEPVVQVPVQFIKYAREWGLLQREYEADQETPLWEVAAEEALAFFVEQNKMIEQANQ